MKCGAIIVGAGRGERFGGATPKAFVMLGTKPLYLHSLKVFLIHPRMEEVVLVVPPEMKKNIIKKGIRVVAGGESRQASVENGLKALSPDVEAVLVHDAARPFVSGELIDKILEQVGQQRNCIAAIPVADTIKTTEGSQVIKTLDRRNLWSAQTPQAFWVAVLKEAYAKAQKEGYLATDEAALVERLGIPVYLVHGDPLNIKITTPGDLDVAKAILRERGL